MICFKINNYSILWMCLNFAFDYVRYIKVKSFTDNILFGLGKKQRR